MGYELLIRTLRPDAPISEAALVARFEEARASGVPEASAAPVPPVTPAAPADPAPTEPAASPAPSGAGPWTLPNARGRVEARLARVEGTLRGADLDVPFGGTEDELRRAFAFAQATAAAAGGEVFDPQLGRSVGRGAVDEVVARWRQSQDFMVDVAGTFEDTRGLVAYTEPPPLVGTRGKIILVLVAGFALLYWALGAVAELLR